MHERAYREWAPRPELARHVASVWLERAPYRDRVLPDGYVDLIWSGTGAFVRGADTHAHAITAEDGRVFVGVRIRPGAATPVLGLPASELVDTRVGISALWGDAAMRRFEGTLAAAASPPDALQALVLERLVGAPQPDGAVDAIAVALRSTGRRVRSLADAVGLSERQLHRRCVDALGYGPQVLARILRFQRFLALAPTTGLAVAAAAAGYADQPHLSRECRRLAGQTPSELVRFVQDLAARAG